VQPAPRDRSPWTAFEQHAFISYAHVDNLTTPDDNRGWVTRFQQQLASYLSSEIATEARLWRDDRLRGNEVFGNEIVSQFPKTALLIAVMSPRYIESDWCLRELTEFCAAAERTGIFVDDKTRVVRVLLKPMSEEQRARLPPALRADESLGYPFFEEVEGKRTLRLDPTLGNGEAYRRSVMFLAEDLAEVISRLDRSAPAGAEAPAAATPPPLTVFLAECGADRRDDRERLRAELKAHLVQVLPEQRLPEVQDEFVAQVDRLLERCQLAIHLVGASYGNVPDGPGMKSGVVLQNECAIRRSRATGLPRLIWLPEGTVPTVEPQAQFIAALKASAELQTGADLITGPLQVFKTAMHASIARLRQPPAASPVDAPDAAAVYLLCDEKDRKATVPLRKLLREKGFEAALPAFEGDAAAVREANQRLLVGCAAVLLFYGAGGEAWKRSTDNELRKQLAMRPSGGETPVWTALGDPTTAHKDDLVDMDEPRLIDARGGLVAERLGPLLQTLATARATR